MMLDQFKLSGRSALVISGNRGLGIEVAKALAEAGASVAIAGRDSSKNEEAVALEDAVGEGKVIDKSCDVTDAGQVEQIVGEVKSELGSVDIFINSAGIKIGGAIEEVTPEDFRSVLDVDVTGT